MKFISYILVFYLAGLTISPATIILYNSLRAQCMMECSMNTSDTCDISDMECCPPVCNPAQCCFCCFLCTIDQKKPGIRVYQSEISSSFSEKQYALSDFISDCWQPPETGAFDSHRQRIRCSGTS